MKEISAIDYFKELVDKNGVAVSTVSDGHMLMFKRSFLQELLDKNPEHDKVLIFVKTSEFKN